MRTPIVIFLLLTGLALQPALAGGWGHGGGRRAPPQPRQQPQRQQQPQYRGPERPPQGYGPPQRPPLSRYDAMNRAQMMNGGGRVLAADPAQGGYRVRVLKDGEVRSFYVPGQ